MKRHCPEEHWIPKRWQIKRIIINGILAYERKLKDSRTKPGWKLHRTSKESSGKRWRKKLLDKTEWFKKNKKVVEVSPGKASKLTHGAAQKHTKKQIMVDAAKPNLKTRSVLFVDQTHGGKLAKSEGGTYQAGKHAWVQDQGG